MDYERVISFETRYVISFKLLTMNFKIYYISNYNFLKSLQCQKIN